MAKIVQIGKMIEMDIFAPIAKIPTIAVVAANANVS